MNIYQKLEALADPAYREFQKKLIPGEEAILGVRMPDLRRLAAQIMREEGADYLRTASDGTLEEVLLQGILIGRLRLPPEQVLPLIRNFVPKIRNWAVCDTFCTDLKIAARYPELFWEFIQPYLQDRRPWFIRFGAVMGMKYFADPEHIPALLDRYGAVQSRDYYVQMGIAWGISECYVRCPEQTLAFLRRHDLDRFTCRKALQKIMESYRVTPEEKAVIRQMQNGM